MSRFEWAGPNSAKVRCTICRATGWGPVSDEGLGLMPWQIRCLGPHDHRCTCGRAFPNASGLASHVSPRRWPRDAAYTKAHQPAQAAIA